MKLFAYYALHSFKNQIKKLFKTWIFVFVVVCMLLGLVFGLAAAFFVDSDIESPPENPSGEETVSQPEEDDKDFFETLGIKIEDALELAIGGVILAVTVIMVMGADKNGGKIFLPADVGLLFPSPMKPQSVLMFRLTTRLGMAVLGSAYLLFQIPNFLNMGLKLWSVLTLMATWCFTMVYGTLLQMLLYTLFATYPKIKRSLKIAVYLLLLLVAAGYLLTLKRYDGNYLYAANAFFNGKFSRFIPVWGWLKGFCMCAVEDNTVGWVLCLSAILLCGSLLIYLIWHIKADFYEDAMTKSEEVAKLLEKAQSENSGAVLFKRKKDRSEKLKRDGLKHGSGANVFFFKEMYNRFRFAHLGFFTKTMELYLIFAVIVGLFCRFSVKIPSIVPLALVLAASAFFRSLGNSTDRDSKTDFFLMIPESSFTKLFWSVAAGTVNCILDTLPPLVVGALVVGANPLTALLWVPLIASLDFYSTNVSIFINLSVPVAAGRILKQAVQVLFFYFGLLPDILLFIFGMVMGSTALAAILSTLVNTGFGLLFFSVSPLFLRRQ